MCLVGASTAIKRCRISAIVFQMEMKTQHIFVLICVSLLKCVFYLLQYLFQNFFVVLSMPVNPFYLASDTGADFLYVPK